VESFKAVAADDLSTPLDGQKPKARRRLPDVMPLLAVFIGVVLAIFIGWIALVNDPLGGEPVGVVAIQRSLPPQSPAQGADVQSAEAPGGDEATGQAAAVQTLANGPLIIKVPEVLAAKAAAAPTVLLESSHYGDLPRIAADGRRPAEVYAYKMKAVPPAGAPCVAILVDGLGLDSELTEKAIADLPGAVTLGFNPYADDVAALVEKARKIGHEVTLQLPLEPFDYPSNDPGPQTLLTGLPTSANMDRLHWVMGRATGYVGLSTYMGGRFLGKEAALAPVLTEIGHRGLLFVDCGAAPDSVAAKIGVSSGAVVARGNSFIGAVSDGGDIDTVLARLEDEARHNGTAIGVAHASPLVLQHLKTWLRGLQDRGITLIPVSAAATRRSSAT
jgi:polysaccharide deacetylase 2 family uncharacterized protein YibQ